jgi:hypothetical protein
MDWLSSRTVPVAVIGSPKDYAVKRTLLVFRPVIKPANGKKPVEMRVTEDLSPNSSVPAVPARVPQTNHLCKIRLLKLKRVKLVVVMSAVDWWKNP